jgi:hypothetical protein
LCIKSTNVAGTSDEFRIGFEDFTICRPGRANANAHGLDLGFINTGVLKTSYLRQPPRAPPAQ